MPPKEFTYGVPPSAYKTAKRSHPPAQKGAAKAAANLAQGMALANALTRGSKFQGGLPAKRPKAKKGTPIPRKSGSLSLAAAKYAAAILNPWAPESDGASIPYGNGRPTQKSKTFQRFDITVGTLGVGWVAVAPCLANGPTGGTLAYFTGAAYAGNSCVPYFSVPLGLLNTGVSTVICANAGYSDAALAQSYTTNGIPDGNEVFGRVVSCGLTATYTGTTLNEGGLLYCFVDPDHASVVGATPALLGSRAECDVTNVSRMKCQLVDYPLSDEEAVFDRTSQYQAATSAALTSIKAVNVAYYPFASAFGCVPDISGSSVIGVAPVGPQPTMVVLVTGTPGNTVHIEIVQHLEFQGLGAEGKTTPSSIDVAGYNSVRGAAASAVQRRANRGGGTMAEEFLTALDDQMKAMRPITTKDLLNHVGA